MAIKSSELPRGLYWKSGILYYSIGYRGRMYRESTGTTSVHEALDLRRRRLAEIVKGERVHENTAHVTCHDLLTNYLNRLERTSKADSETYTITKGTIEKHVLPFFGWVKAEKVTKRLLEQYRDLKIDSLSQVSVNRQLGYLRTAFKEGKRDKLTNNELDFSTTIIRSAEEENVRTGIITEAQYKRLIGCFGNDIHVLTLFMLCWNTGVRPAEAFRLEWAQIDRKNRLIAVFKRQDKTGKPRYLPLRQEAYQQLMAWEEYLKSQVKNAKYIFTHSATGERMAKNDYKTPWANACVKAGYATRVKESGRWKVKNDLLFYDARRAFRTYLPTDVNTTDGKMVMGHSQQSTFERYMEPKTAALRVLEAMEVEKTSPENARAGYEKVAAIKDLIVMRNAGDITPEEFTELKAALYTKHPVSV